MTLDTQYLIRDTERYNGMKKNIGIIGIILIAGILRFYNLMHDAPYFFNPDERNMASAITQFRLPSSVPSLISCAISEFSLSRNPASPAGGQITNNRQQKTDNRQPTTDNCSLNPHFFAYGQFPLYLAFVSDQTTSVILNSFQHLNPQQDKIPKQIRDSNILSTDFSSAIFWLRFYSALSSTLIVLAVYKLTKLLMPMQHTIWLLASLITAFIPSLIQSSHFGTTESLLAFFFIYSTYLSVLLYQLFSSHQKKQKKLLKKVFTCIFLLSLSIGLALGSKFTGLFFLVPPGLSILFTLINMLIHKKSRNFFMFIFVSIVGICIIFGSVTFGIISSPYNLVEPENFKSAVFGYEKDVAMGKYEAFYTRQFANTTPILFQFEKVFPYVLGWPLFILGVLGFTLLIASLLNSFLQRVLQGVMYYVLRIKQKKNKIDICTVYYLILTSSFLVYLIPNAFLFAKWSRFMTPIIPSFAIFSAFVLWKMNTIFNISTSSTDEQFPNNTQLVKYKNLLNIGYWLLVISFILPGIAFMSIYTNEDSRLAASKWIYQNLPNNSYVLSETANVIDIPLGIPDNILEKQFRNGTVVSFDFYHLDENPQLYDQLLDHLVAANYIFVPSRRIFKNYPRIPHQYPLVSRYYELLFSHKLGFEEVKTISSFPQLSLANLKLATFPDEDAEETYTVFDHPVIRIYKKIDPMTKEQYVSLLRPGTL